MLPWYGVDSTRCGGEQAGHRSDQQLDGSSTANRNLPRPTGTTPDLFQPLNSTNDARYLRFEHPTQDGNEVLHRTIYADHPMCLGTSRAQAGCNHSATRAA
jgi:hypothetical protein